MSIRRDPDAILAAWLDEGPAELPDVTRRAILGALPTTRRAGSGWVARWARPDLSLLGRVAVAAAVAVIAIGGVAYVAGPILGPGAAPSPSPSPTPTPSAAPTAEPTGSASPARSLGTVTLRDEVCEPGEIPATIAAGPMELAYSNEQPSSIMETAIWQLRGTIETFQAFFDERNRLLGAGQPLPGGLPPALALTDMGDPVAGGTTGTLRAVAPSGATLAIHCAKGDPATGEPTLFWVFGPITVE